MKNIFRNNELADKIDELESALAKTIEDKVNEAVKKLKPKEVKETKTPRTFLITYQWWNEITNARGDSSVIISLKKTEKMNGAKIKDMQDTILDQISRAGHPNDPSHVVILNVTQLES